MATDKQRPVLPLAAARARLSRTRGDGPPAEPASPARAGARLPPGDVGTEVTLSISWDGYLSLRALAAYSSLSERSLRGFLRAADHPLPHFRVGDRILVRRSDFDRWIEDYRAPAPDAGEVVRRLLARLDGPGQRP